MKHGVPFQTKSMDELRTSQRQLLREVPRIILSRALTADRRPLDRKYHREQHDDLAMAEDVIRRDVVGHLLATPALAELVTAVRGYARAEQLASLVGHRQLEENYFDPVVERASELRDANPLPPRVPAELVAPFYGLINLLLLGDELADDGYEDPRVATLVHGRD